MGHHFTALWSRLRSLLTQRIQPPPRLLERAPVPVPVPCPFPVAVCCAGQRGRRQPPAASRQAGSITRPSPNTQRPHAPWAVVHSSTQTSLHYGDGESSKDRKLFQVVPVSRSTVPRATEDRVPATALHQLFIARARNRARFTTLLLSTVTLQVLLRFCSLTVLGANEVF